MALKHQWQFLATYLRAPTCVGSIVPSSRALAEAVCDPYRRASRPVRVLEVGAGTGAITRVLGTMIADGDEVDLCEIQPAFADILERDVLSLPVFRKAAAEGRVRVLRQPIQALEHENYYDFVIGGLPLTIFTLDQVKEVFEIIERCLKPGGVFSYYEYVGLRFASRTFTIGPKRDRYRSVSAYLNGQIQSFEFCRKTVLLNFLPAYAHHLRFTEGNGNSEGHGNGRYQRLTAAS